MSAPSSTRSCATRKRTDRSSPRSLPCTRPSVEAGTSGSSTRRLSRRGRGRPPGASRAWSRCRRVLFFAAHETDYERIRDGCPLSAWRPRGFEPRNPTCSDAAQARRDCRTTNVDRMRQGEIVVENLAASSDQDLALAIAMELGATLSVVRGLRGFGSALQGRHGDLGAGHRSTPRSLRSRRCSCRKMSALSWSPTRRGPSRCLGPKQAK